MRISEKIKSYRKKCNLSLKDLHEATGIPIARLSDVENAKGNPTLRTIYKIEEALGCKIIPEY